jgi:alcohol dehydrogenase class IV
VTAWSAPVALTRYADCARAMGLAQAGEGEQATVARLVEALHEVNRDLAVPTPKSYGIAEAEWQRLLPLMAEQALASGSPANNPRQPTAAEMVELYREAWA